MSESARDCEPDESDTEAPAGETEQSSMSLAATSADRTLFVKMIAIQAGWRPGPTLNVSGDELSAMVIRMRRGELEEEADEQSGTEG